MFILDDDDKFKVITNDKYFKHLSFLLLFLLVCFQLVCKNLDFFFITFENYFKEMAYVKL